MGNDRLVASRSDEDEDDDDDDDDDDTIWTMPGHDNATYAFIRSKQIDLHGIASTVATHMVKHYEPCSDILDLIGAYTSEY